MHVPTVIDGDFEWDDAKAASNLARHGVSFEEAQSIFADPRVAVLDDGSGSRVLLGIGLSRSGRLLAVVHVERDDRDRLVSARVTTSEEEHLYATGEPG
jgi:uncharacterized protein